MGDSKLNRLNIFTKQGAKQDQRYSKLNSKSSEMRKQLKKFLRCHQDWPTGK